MLCVDGDDVGWSVFLWCIPHYIFEDVVFIEIECSFTCFERYVGGWEVFDGVEVDVEFVVHAAFEFAALSCELDWVE